VVHADERRGPTTVTIAATHTTTNKIFYAVREWAGKCTLDKSATAVLTVTSTAATTGTTAATMVASEFALAMFGLSTAQTSWTKDANYTLPTTNLTSDATQARALASEYRDLVATGTQVATGTMATTCLNATIIATFINPTGGIPDVGMALTVT
jgi:hypothetical protein